MDWGFKALGISGCPIPQKSGTYPQTGEPNGAFNGIRIGEH